jgi:hypothetical protein
MIPAWILDIFAAIMLLVAGLSAARLVVARPWQSGSAVTDTDVSHLLMGIAMAGTLAPNLATLPDGAWEVVFGMATAWFAYRVVRDARANGVRALAGAHCAPHLVHSAAMLYMFAAIAGPAGAGGGSGGGMSGMGGGPALQYPTLALVFALTLAGYCVWDLDQLSGGRYRSAGPRHPEPRGGGLALAGADGSVISAGPATANDILLSAGMTVACRIAMGATMAFMLLIMI